MRAGTLSLSALLILLFNPVQVPAQIFPEQYFFYQGAPYQLQGIIPDTLVVGFAPDASEPQILDFLAANNLSGSFLFRPRNYWRVAVTDLQQTYPILMGSELVLFAHPFFRSGPKATFYSNRLLVSWRPGVPRSVIQDFLLEHGLSEVDSLPWGSWSYELPPRASEWSLTVANLLFRTGLVRHAEPDFFFEALSSQESCPYPPPADPYYPNQWNVDTLHVRNAWDLGCTKGSNTLKVGVIDTGIDLDHPDLVPNLTAGYSAWCGGPWMHLRSPATLLEAAQTCPPGLPCDGAATGGEGYEDHGTKVAGIIGADDNVIGIVGIAPDVLIMPLKASERGCQEPDQWFRWEWVAWCIYYARTHGAKIVNMSLGGSDPSNEVAAQIDASPAIVFTAAAGNTELKKPHDDSLCPDKMTAVEFPARHPGVIAVGSTRQDDVRDDNHSAIGCEVEVVAPGKDIFTTDYGPNASTGDYEWIAHGTSAASPHAAGVAALLRSIDPTLGRTKVRAILQVSAKDIKCDPDINCEEQWLNQRDEYTGFGRIWADSAVHVLLQTPPTITARLVGLRCVEVDWSASEWAGDPLIPAYVYRNGELRTITAGTSLIETVPANTELAYFVIFGIDQTGERMGRTTVATVTSGGGLPICRLAGSSPGGDLESGPAPEEAEVFSLELVGNAPNPFSPPTTITYVVPGPPGSRERVSLAVYDLRGRLVRTLVQAQETAGAHQVHWDGRDDRGRSLVSGVYFCRVTAGGRTRVRRLLLLK